MLPDNKVSCRVCSGLNTSIAFEGLALEKYSFQMQSCQDCGFLFIDDPHWLSEAYSSPIAACDTGLVYRNISISERLQVLLFYLFGHDGTYLDIAGGTGLLVRLMRDQGYDFHWYDPYCKNIHSVGFESEPGKSYTGITAFEVLEHLTDPVSFLKENLRATSAELLICSTELFEGKPPGPEWWYYAFPAGQHIAFYKASTLKTIADKLDLNVFSVSGFHFFGSADIIEKIKKLYGSRLIRYKAMYRIKSQMKSKIMDDHQKMLKQTNIASKVE